VCSRIGGFHQDKADVFIENALFQEIEFQSWYGFIFALFIAYLFDISRLENLINDYDLFRNFSNIIRIFRMVIILQGVDLLNGCVELPDQFLGMCLFHDYDFLFAPTFRVERHLALPFIPISSGVCIFSYSMNRCSTRSRSETKPPRR